MDEQKNEQSIHFTESWAIVEQMGHNKFAGKVSEQIIGGASLLRLDVPELPERKRTRRVWDYEKQEAASVEETVPGRPAFTKFIGVGSIFALTPCTEEVERAAAESFRVEPVTCVDIPSRLALPAGPDGDDQDEDDEDL